MSVDGNICYLKYTPSVFLIQTWLSKESLKVTLWHHQWRHFHSFDCAIYKWTSVRIYLPSNIVAKYGMPFNHGCHVCAPHFSRCFSWNFYNWQNCRHFCAKATLWPRGVEFGLRWCNLESLYLVTWHKSYKIFYRDMYFHWNLNRVRILNMGSDLT